MKRSLVFPTWPRLLALALAGVVQLLMLAGVSALFTVPTVVFLGLSLARLVARNSSQTELLWRASFGVLMGWMLLQFLALCILGMSPTVVALYLLKTHSPALATRSLLCSPATHWPRV